MKPIRFTITIFSKLIGARRWWADGQGVEHEAGRRLWLYDLRCIARSSFTYGRAPNARRRSHHCFVSDISNWSCRLPRYRRDGHLGGSCVLLTSSFFSQRPIPLLRLCDISSMGGGPDKEELLLTLPFPQQFFPLDEIRTRFPDINVTYVQASNAEAKEEAKRAELKRT